MDVLEVLLLLRVEVAEHALREHFREPEDRVHGRPQLVGHVREKLALVLARAGELAVGRLELVEQAHVLDRDHRLGGEGLEERDLDCRKRSGLASIDDNDPDGVPLAHHWHGKHAAEAAGPRDVLRILRILQRILDLNDRPAQDRAPGHQPPVRPHRKRFLKRLPYLRRVVIAGCEVHHLAIESDSGSSQPITQPHGASHDRVEDRLHVGRRAADHPQDLARCRQVAIASLQLGEQAHVLDGDHRLGGEGLEERDLVGGERPRVPARDRDEAEGDILAEHRNEQVGVPPASPAGLPHDVRDIRGGRHVFDRMGSTIAHRALARREGPKRHGEHMDERGVGLGTGRGVGHEIERLALAQEHHAGRVAVEQPQAAADDRVEDRLHLGRRARHRAQDLGRGGLLIERPLQRAREPFVLGGRQAARPAETGERSWRQNHREYTGNRRGPDAEPAALLIRGA